MILLNLLKLALLKHTPNSFTFSQNSQFVIVTGKVSSKLVFIFFFFSPSTFLSFLSFFFWAMSVRNSFVAQFLSLFFFFFFFCIILLFYFFFGSARTHRARLCIVCALALAFVLSPTRGIRNWARKN